MGSDNAEDMPEGLPDREQLMKAVETAQAAHKAQSTANDLKSKAQAMTDPTKREKLLREAYDKEIEANGHSKMAKRLQSGTWQGLGFGGGMGAAAGLGLGAGVGTVLGAVTAIPTTGLGMLIGSGVGAIHGPWVKLGGKEQKLEDADPGEVVDALEQERDSQSKAEPEPQATTAAGDVPSGAGQKPRKKPKKLEIRSQPKPDAGQQVGAGAEQDSATSSSAATQKTRRKPKKLEVRSAKSGSRTTPKADP